MGEGLNPVWAATLVAALQRSGVRHAVVCPGSRSTPLALACADAAGLKVWSLIDERTAGFFALGLARALRAPVAVLCTSGTAGAHFLPAASEAFISGVPLVLLTADRPWELQGFGAPQTMPQAGLFGRFVRAEEALPAPLEGEAARRHLVAVVDKALARGAHGPVHFNVPFAEPLAPVDGARSPVVSLHGPRVIAAQQRVDEGALATVREALRHAERGLIVCGPREGGDGFGAAVHALGEALGFPVWAEAASNARYGFDGALGAIDVLLRHAPTASALRPEVVLRFGGGLTPKVPQAFLDTSQARQFLFCEHGEPVDPAHAAELVLLGDALEAIARLPQGARPAQGGYRAQWHSAQQRARSALEAAGAGAAQLEAALTEPEAARLVVRGLPPGANLMASSSMPIRDLDAFAVEPRGRLRVFANRGVNGIDGVLSTALGVAAGSEAPTAVLIGDLATQHDVGGLLAARTLGLSLTVVVINNDGGGIFDFLPVATKTPHFERLFSTPQGLSFEKLAAAAQARFHQPTTGPALSRALAAAMAGGLHLIEVRTERKANVAEHQRLIAAVAQALGGLG